jgi:predicted secreted protein
VAFRHGKNAAVTVDAVDLSAFCDDLSLSTSKDTADTTTFGNDWRTNLAGLRGATFDLSGNYDPTASTGPAAVLFEALDSDDPVAVEYYPGGNTSGQLVYTFDAIVTSYEEAAPVGDKVTFSASLTVTGAVTQGEVS